jgi:2-aminomuconate deaminase
MTRTENVKGALRPRARYPLARRVGDFIFVSGTSARRPDNSFAGVAVDEMGTTSLDIRAQTEAVIENIRTVLEGLGAGLEDLCEVSCFIVNMNDFGGFNEVYNRYFSEETGPARTTVAVHQLPHPHLLVEIKAIAFKPGVDFDAGA